MRLSQNRLSDVIAGCRGNPRHGAAKSVSSKLSFCSLETDVVLSWRERRRYDGCRIATAPDGLDAVHTTPCCANVPF